jgi:hypothetical protein
MGLVAEITDRRLGLEIEGLIPLVGLGSGRDVQNLLAQILTNHGISATARGYSREPIPPGYLLAIEHDSSIRDETRYQGLSWSKIEAKTSPMTYRELNEVLPTALDIINYIGARVNLSCGLHVHVSLAEVVERPLIARNLQHLWWRFHPVLYGLVAPSRKSNSYCVPPRSEDARLYDDCDSYPRLCQKLRQVSRYNGLNLTNLADRNRLTVEWRLHHGSTDWQKIRCWTLLVLRLVEHAAARSCQYHPHPAPNTRAGLNALLISTGLKPNSRVYPKVDRELRQVGRFLLRRWKHFGQPHEGS